MGADDHIHLAGRQVIDDLPRLGLGTEPREHLHRHGIGLQAPTERVIVLLRQHRGGHQHGHLLVVHHSLEGSAQGDLGLAIAHIATDQPIHGPRLLHILLDLDQGPFLVGRLLVREGGLQLVLPDGVGRERIALGHLALGVELQQVDGQRPHRASRPLASHTPVGAAQAVQRRRRAGAPYVPADAVGLLDRHEQAIALGVLQLEVFPLHGAQRLAHHPAEHADAVLHMHHQVAR